MTGTDIVLNDSNPKQSSDLKLYYLHLRWKASYALILEFVS